MAWGNKLTKEDLKEAGLDVDAMNAQLEKLKEVDALKTSVEGVTTKLSALDAIQQSLTALEGKLVVKPKESNNDGNQNQNQNDNKEDELDWITDPAKATQATVNKQMAPVISAVSNVYAEMTYSNFRNSNPRGFLKYEKEIKEMWDKQTQKSPALLENIYKIVIANHIDDIQKEPTTFFVESGGSGKPITTNSGDKKPEELLSKTELEECAKWGISPKDYLEEKTKGAPVAG